MSTDTLDNEITLQRRDLRLRVAPYGASLRGLWRESGDGRSEIIITGYSGQDHKMGGEGDVLIPFPGRVRAGRYSLNGETYQMELSDKEGPNAIHGFVRHSLWKITEQSENAITFAISLRPDEHVGYPFALRMTVSYGLDEEGMTCRFFVENAGERPAPVAAGFHPYFTVGSTRIDTDRLQVPMRSFLEFENLVPTGRVLSVEGTPFDFREPRLIEGTVINTCFLDPVRDADGLLRVRLDDPGTQRGLTVWMDAAFDFLVLYSGDPLPDSHRRRALAIEPMTCGSDAFNHPEWGLAVLDPGQALTGAWGIVTA